jgi:cellulose synthase operon protein C
MTLTLLKIRIGATLLFGVILLTTFPGALYGQVNQSVTNSMLDKAHALEARGRMDLAAQEWQQVLLTDPKNPDALGGLARAAKLEGNIALSNSYLARLKAVNPNDPNIAKAENMSSQLEKSALLEQAGKLAEAGQYAESMAKYRQVFGSTPPAGDWALAYYETESATEDGRPHAVAGLQGLVQKFPSDARYQIALGRILTYNPKTRAEGRKYLEKYPKDAQAVEALRQSLLWDSANPAVAGQIRAYLATHRDPQLAEALKNQGTGRPAPAPLEASAAPGPSAPSRPTRNTRSRPAPPSPQVVAMRAKSAEETEAYKALNDKHIDEAETRFKTILAKDPHNGRALAGMGYVRMQQSNFSGAISYLEEAKQAKVADPGIEAALDTSRFWFIMGEGQVALDANDLTGAEKQYQAALRLRPEQPEALLGLGGTLLKAEQPEPALPVFDKFVQVKPSAPEAWRGLMMSEYGAGNPPLAVATDARIPPDVHASLMQDPMYLRTLAMAYRAVGRDADASRTLEAALNLPFPADSKTLKADTQLEFASILLAANRLDQAAGLYRQVLAANHYNTSAWQGLIRVEHAMQHDLEALQTVESMPQASYASAMRDPGFEATVAAVYQGQKKLDVAQDLLEKAIAQETTAGQKPPVPIQMELAGIYLERGNPEKAYPIYQQVLTDNPNRADAWGGLLSALHTTGHDKEAVAQVQLISPETRGELEQDVNFLETMGSVYGALGDAHEATIFLTREQQLYAARHTTPPAGVDIQDAWLLYNNADDAGLYRQLMQLGGRTDLTPDQRRTIQSIWTDWAVRRANQASAANNTSRSLAILNATAQAFPDNPAVFKALANGYARAGQPQKAVLIYRAENMSSASDADYKAAIGAALQAGDSKDAETWLRYGLKAYPSDPQMLILGAKFEQYRGDSSRAIAYYQASLKAMPKPNPGADLAAELSLPSPSTPSRLPSNAQPQDLSTLLAPGMTDSTPGSQIYLPSYGNTNGAPPVVPGANPYANPYNNPYNNTVPPYMSNPGGHAPPPDPNNGNRLRDYVPQARLHHPSIKLPVMPEIAALVHNAAQNVLRESEIPSDSQADVVLATAALPASPSTKSMQSSTPAQQPLVATNLDGASQLAELQNYQQEQIARLTRQASLHPPASPEAATQPSAANLAAGPPPSAAVKSSPAPAAAQPLTSASVGASIAAGLNTSPMQNAYYAAPAPVQVQITNNPTQIAQAQPELTDVVPTARYAPNARGGQMASSHPDIAAAQAAEIRRRQSNPNDSRSGSSVDELNTGTTQNAQYTTQNGSQTTQPQTIPQGGAVPDSGDQQYPQPGSRPITGTSSPAASSTIHKTTRRKTTAKKSVPAPLAATPGPTPTPQPPMETPPAAQSATNYPPNRPLSTLPYPNPGEGYTLPPAPSDAELMANNVPALRNSQAPIDTVPLSPRQQAEADLAALEGSYSGWFGGTGFARYRSGTPGIDRLYDVEAPVEASFVTGRSIRFTVIPKAVFLNSGALTIGQAGTATIGTLNPVTAPAQPSQQYTTGIGGEFQMTTRDLGLAAGYTPYEFLVRNITGRFRWRPFGGHVTLFADRDSVKDTQLSYAGIRDPGSVSNTFQGNIWGGVIATTGGIRLDTGSNGSGFYLSGDGGVVKGVHVQNNLKYEGSMGAYLRVHSWPQYGSLTVGGSLFGMHYDRNEVGLTYGQGGYFSPDLYFLAAVPITFNGHNGTNFHYTISGAVGVQTFQEDAANLYPLDPGLQTAALSGCSLQQLATKSCGQTPITANTGFNYGLNAEISYRLAEHWYAGAFMSANNTNNYNTIQGGFFFRYMFKRQTSTENYPTGLFPTEGFRPLQVP